MANYANLKAQLDANIYQNDLEAITGSVLNAQLKAIVDALGAGYQFMGVATPTTADPGTPDQKVFYFAVQPGTYAGFGNTVLTDGQIGIFSYGTSWSYTVQTIVSIVDDLTTGGTGKALSAEQGKNISQILEENVLRRMSQTVASTSGVAYSNVINNVNIKAGELVRVDANISDAANPAENRRAYIRYNGVEIVSMHGAQEFMYFFAPYDISSIELYMANTNVTKSNNITFVVTKFGLSITESLKYTNIVAEASIVPSDVNANISLNIDCYIKSGEPVVVVVEDPDESIGSRTVHIRYIPAGGSLTIIEELKNKNRLSQIFRLNEDVQLLNISVTKGTSPYTSGTFKIKIYKFTSDNVLIPLIERASVQELTPEITKDYIVSVENPYFCPCYSGNASDVLNRSVIGVYVKFDSITFYNGGLRIIKTMQDVLSDTGKTAQTSGEYVTGCLLLNTYPNASSPYHQALGYDKVNNQFVVTTDTIADDGRFIYLAYAKGGRWCGIICEQFDAIKENNESVYLKQPRRSYIDTLRDKELELLAADNHFAFGLCSDVHFAIFNDTNSPINVTNAVMEELDRYIGFDAIVNGGDNILYGSSFKRHGMDALTQAFRTIELSKLIPCVGNHDYNGKSSPAIQEKSWTITDKEIETLFFRHCKNSYRPDGKLYYYRDFDEKKVRVVVLNTQDVPIEFNNNDELIYDPLTVFGISQNQIDFIVSALDISGKSSPEDWKFVFVMHVGLYSNSEGMIGNGSLINRAIVRNILKAFVNRSSYSYSSTDTQYDGIFTVEGSVNFANAAGKLVAVFSGHTHHDSYVNTDGFNCITIQCSYPTAEHEETSTSVPSMPPMTYSEFAIDAVILDDERQKVVLKRFGCHHSLQNPDGDREYYYDV